MKKTTMGWIALAAMLATGAGNLQAQEPVDARPGRAFRRGADVERIMSMRERLELTDDQVAALDALRAEGVERRNQEAAEMARLRSQMSAGQIERSELMAYREQRAAAREEFQAQHRDRVNAVLTPDQRGTLDQMRLQAEAFRRGRASARAERGPRAGGNAWGPESRRRGLGPEDGWNRPRRGFEGRQGRGVEGRPGRGFDQRPYRRPGGTPAPGRPGS